METRPQQVCKDSRDPPSATLSVSTNQTEMESVVPLENIIDVWVYMKFSDCDLGYAALFGTIFRQICPGLTLIRCMQISISITKCLIALLLNFNITRFPEY